jgi:hypothetical protein
VFSDKSRVLLVLLFLIAGVVAPGSALCELTLSVQPDSAIVDLGSEFRLGFYLGEDTTDLMGYNVVFSYDPGRLEIVSIEEGFMPAGSSEDTFFHSSSGDSTVEINGAVLGGVVQTPGYIFTVVFKGIKEGKVYIEIEDSDIRDDSNTAIPHTTERGVVIIVPDVPVQESSWGGLKARFR